MSDANLIKGEQYVRANRGAGSVYDVGSAFGQGVATADAQIQLVRDQEKIARREIANKTEQWGSQLDGNIDASAVPDVYRQGITDFLLNQRSVYWEHAKAASNSEVGSEAYQAAVAGMNGVNSAVKNLRVQLDSYNTGSTAFAEASDSNHISGGMPLDELAVSEQVYSHTLPMHINDTGDIAFSNEDGNVMDLKDMPTLKLKDFKANNAYLGLAGKIYQSGNKLNGSLATLHRGSVRNILRGNRDTLLHMATDDSIIDGGFGIVDPHSLSTEELTTRMEDAMMDALGQVANDGYNAKHPGPSSSDTKEQRAYKAAENRAIKDFKAAMGSGDWSSLKHAKFDGKHIHSVVRNGDTLTLEMEGGRHSRLNLKNENDTDAIIAALAGRAGWEARDAVNMARYSQ